MDESFRDRLIAEGAEAPTLGGLLSDVRSLIDRQEGRARFWARAGIVALACAGLAGGAYALGAGAPALLLLPLATAAAVLSGLLTLWFRRAVDGPRLRAILRELSGRLEELER